MSSVALPNRITVDEFLERDHDRLDGMEEELIDGEIIVSPNAKKVHTNVSSNAFELLLPLKRQGFKILGEVACRLTSDSLPNTDVAVIEQKRWDAVGDDDFIRESPALVIEVRGENRAKRARDQAPHPKVREVILSGGAHPRPLRSPKNTKTKLLRKVELYLEHGAEQCWVIYPKQRRVTIFFPDGTNEQVQESDTVSFHGCIIPVKDLFGSGPVL